MLVSIDILIERALAKMEAEMKLTEAQKNYYREIIREKLVKEGKLYDRGRDHKKGAGA